METVVANVTAKARKATLNGRNYLVAPATLIVPGVLEGSSGTILYEPAEIAASVGSWNGVPLVGYHPLKDGGFVSARSPEVLEKHGLGAVYNAAFGDKLTAELWFDEGLTGAFDATLSAEHKVIPRLNAGQAVELSTGLLLQKKEAPAGATHNGRAYQFIGTSYAPDHLAILPDQQGACGVKDGCGVFNSGKGLAGLFGDWAASVGRFLTLNGFSAKPPLAATPVVVNEMSHEQLRDALQRELKSRFTQADPYCYVCEVYDGYFIYEQGMKSYRLDYSQTDAGVTVSGEPVEVVRTVEYVPTGGEATMNRTQLIDFLVANCDCWKGANDKETLNKLPDDKLAALKASAEKAKAAEVVANAAKKSFTDAVTGTEHVWNEAAQAWQAKPKPAATPAPEVPVTQPVTNRLSPEEAEDLAFARAERTRQKQAMIDRLTANVADAAQKAAAQAVYAAMNAGQLVPLVAALPPVPAAQQVAPAYWGGASPPPVANAARSDEDNLLPEITLDFEEHAAAGLRRKKA